MPKRWSAILVMPAMRDRVHPGAPVYIITSSRSGRCQRLQYHSLLMRRRLKYWHICHNMHSTEHRSPRLFKRRQLDGGVGEATPTSFSLLMIARAEALQVERHVASSLADGDCACSVWRPVAIGSRGSTAVVAAFKRRVIGSGKRPTD